MSQTCTNPNELELLSIFTVAQDKLQSNFTKIMNRFNQFDQQMKMNVVQTEKNKKLIENLRQQMNNKFMLKQENEDEKLNEMKKIIDENMEKLKEKQKQIQDRAEECRKIREEELILKGRIEQEQQIRQSSFYSVEKSIKMLQAQIKSISNALSSKQSVVEVQKLTKSVDHLKRIIQSIGEKEKFTQYKLEKIEILNEKANKIQKDKEAQMMKEMQEKIKTEIKRESITKLQGSNVFLPNFGGQNQKSVLDLNESEDKIQIEEQVENIVPKKDLTRCKTIHKTLNPNNISMRSIYEKDPKKATMIQSRNNLQREQKNSENMTAVFYNNTQINNNKMLTTLSDKVCKIQHKFKNFEEHLKKISSSSGSSSSGNNNSNHEIVEKINQVKPEMVKIWTKCDSLEDRSVYNEKKLEDLIQTVQKILDLQKQSHFSKLEEKMSTLQTQFFTNVKEIKAKIQTKVNVSDLDKSLKTVNEALHSITEQLVIKSDKIEVKKALLFIEMKIKEIILVISEDEENEKDALLTKKQIKCMSCNKELDKFNGVVNNVKGNWDSMPYKEHSPELLGKFGMTNFGVLAKKVKKLDNSELPILTKTKQKDFTVSDHKPTD